MDKYINYATLDELVETHGGNRVKDEYAKLKQDKEILVDVLKELIIESLIPDCYCHELDEEDEICMNCYCKQILQEVHG